jgi:hypothetical protein
MPELEDGTTRGAAFLTLMEGFVEVEPKANESGLTRGEAAGEVTVEVALGVKDGGARVEAADMVECTSVVDICFPIEAIAHPASAPAAPVAELTRAAWDPLAVDAVVTGP